MNTDSEVGSLESCTFEEMRLVTRVGDLGAADRMRERYPESEGWTFHDDVPISGERKVVRFRRLLEVRKLN